MINTKIAITNFSAIDNQISKIKIIKSDQSSLMEFLKVKFLKALNETIDERLINVSNGEQGGVTDSEYFEEYKLRNKFMDIPNGFILYNDTVIPQSMLPIRSKKTLANYPNGFSLALAFEFGVGIVGENAPVEGAWEYNVAKHNFYWTYEKYGKKYATYGYKGMEIYRFTVAKIKDNINDWIKEYFGKVV